MIIYTPPKPAESIPLIDLGPSFSEDLAARKAVAWEIHKTARDTGFFYIANHGVPQTLMDGQLDLAREFFDLPLEEKIKVDASRSSCTRGYETPGLQTLDDGSPPDLKEGFLRSISMTITPMSKTVFPTAAPTSGRSSPRTSVPATRLMLTRCSGSVGTLWG